MLLLGEIAKRFGPKALEPEHYHESNWSTDTWTRGCFTGFLTPGATSLFGSAVRDPVGPIRWAGTETATHWPSFIDGAIRFRRTRGRGDHGEGVTPLSSRASALRARPGTHRAVARVRNGSRRAASRLPG